MRFWTRIKRLGRRRALARIRRGPVVLGMFMTVTALLASPSAAVAYRHVDNAQAACASVMRPYADAWFVNNGYGNVGPMANGPWSVRYGNDSVVVHAVFKTYTHGQAEVRCWVTGPDGPGGVVFGSGYPYWTYLDREDYPYAPCYGYALPGGFYCLHDPGF